ncbi:hypothetical protein Micbo1qcDRAFT_205329 [Microdochium bolleyi]|uniref:Uncharacterized protein n=1 Tax=Microdochium bolleyi TaxID=196109 RepID=A0A136J0A4_9PEZI|nr:hypothetical protein Micbo1qcDRAFT_205329 [Microdochium bolleyi]
MTLYLPLAADLRHDARQNSQPNPNVSLGSCYYAAGSEAGSNFIPCGNSAFGFYTCCQAGDNCISGNACFNYRDQITYLASCTDPSYSAASCPNKGSYGDQQWSGIVQCSAQAGTWANCEEASGAVAVGDANPSCTCAGRPPLFTAAAFLAPKAQLPLTAGGSISWYSGFAPPSGLTPTGRPSSSSTTRPNSSNPTTTSSSTTTPTSSANNSPSPSPSAPSSSNNSPPPTAPPGSDDSSTVSSSGPLQTSTTGGAAVGGTGSSSSSTTDGSSLSTGSKIGIGVGTAAAGLLLIGLIAFLLIARRRRHRDARFDDNGNGSSYGGAFDAVPSPPAPQPGAGYAAGGGGGPWMPPQQHQHQQRPWDQPMQQQQRPYGNHPSYYRPPAAGTATGAAGPFAGTNAKTRRQPEPVMLDGTPVSPNRRSELPGDSTYDYPVSTASPVTTATSGVGPGSPSPPSTVDHNNYNGVLQPEREGGGGRGLFVVNPDIGSRGSPNLAAAEPERKRQDLLYQGQYEQYHTQQQQQQPVRGPGPGSAPIDLRQTIQSRFRK